MSVSNVVKKLAELRGNLGDNSAAMDVVVAPSIPGCRATSDDG